jgi:hypothetical protein
MKLFWGDVILFNHFIQRILKKNSNFFSTIKITIYLIVETSLLMILQLQSDDTVAL